MPLSDANLRYLFAVSDLAAGGRPVRSKEVADVLGVTRPSVVRVLRRWQASLVLAAALPDTEYLRRCPPILKTPEGSGCEA